MPWDRVWAIAHEASKFDRSARDWAACPNFVLCSKASGLQAISALVDETTGVVTLTHPVAGTLQVNPDLEQDAEKLVRWSAAFVPANRAAPAYVAKATRGMTDTDFPSLSILSHSSLEDLSMRAGVKLSADRFRGNLWVDGWEPWSELNLIDREISIGKARFLVRERIRRCTATATNTETGVVDFDTPGFIEGQFGHRDFGIYAEVITSGDIAVGDTVLVH